MPQYIFRIAVNLGTKISVDRYQTCLMCATDSLAISKMSMAKVKVAQNCHVFDHSEKKLHAMFYTYPIQFEVC